MKELAKDKKGCAAIQMLLDIQLARENVLAIVNSCFDNLISRIDVPKDVSGLTDSNNAVHGGYALPIGINPAIFVGKKPVAVVLGEERIYVKSWREVLTGVLERCCQDPLYHERLMALRGKVAGNFRFFLSDKPDGMSKAVMVANDLYVEAHHGSQAMMTMLVEKLLKPIGYNHSNISVEVR